jgi:putative ABC transport system permease protein
MFKNYLIVAMRNLMRHKAYTRINIAGLSVGMACTILIVLWVGYELSFDRYHENADRIFRLAANIEIGEMRGGYAVSNPPIGQTLQKDYPEVLRAARFYPHERKLLVHYKDKIFLENGIIYMEDAIFDVFKFPSISGDPNTALATADSLVITEAMAAKLCISGGYGCRSFYSISHNGVYDGPVDRRLPGDQSSRSKPGEGSKIRIIRKNRHI